MSSSAMNTPGDLLLYWLSDRKYVSHCLASQAVRQLLFKLTTRIAQNRTDTLDSIQESDHAEQRLRRNSLYWMRTLHRLGHVERRVNERGREVGWEIVPPSFLWINQQKVIYCGLRTPELMQALTKVFGASRVELTCHPSHPDEAALVILHVSKKDFQGQLQELESSGSPLNHRFSNMVRCGTERSLELLKSCPPLEFDASKLPLEASTVLSDQYFGQTKTGWGWKKTHQDDAWCKSSLNLIRQQTPLEYWWWDGRDYRELDRESRILAQWELRRKANDLPLHYYELEQRLSVPASPGLPLLIERALIMSSGQLPTHAAAKNTYDAICLERAQQVARIMSVKLTVTGRPADATVVPLISH